MQRYLGGVKESQLRTKGYFDPSDLLLYCHKPEDFIYNTDPIDSFGSNCLEIFVGYISEHQGFAIINGSIEGDGIIKAYKVGSDLQQYCQVIFTCKRDEVLYRYESLTSMMQAFAQFYEEHDNYLQGSSSDAFFKEYLQQKQYDWKIYNPYANLAAPFDDFPDELIELYECKLNQISATADFDFIDDSIELPLDTSLESSQ